MLLAPVLAAVAAAAPPVASVVAAGDVASCVSDGDEATAALVEQLPGTVAVLGDAVYNSGTQQEFAECYEPSWGRFKTRTRPAAGNHEYWTRGAAGYYAYFGAAAGHPGRGYYTYTLDAWRVIVLNSNCVEGDGCAAGGRQLRWLRALLRSRPARCTLAYWHHPRFSSGLHGDHPSVGPFWAALYAASADVVLSGHDHNYERFAPLDPSGRLDRRRGLRQFVVGTGGASHYWLRRRAPGSQVRNARTFGVLHLTLRPAGYSWRFVPVAGETFTDAGSGRCH